VGIAGADAWVALRADRDLGSAPFCAGLTLRWHHFLVAPFARFVLPAADAGGRPCLRVRAGGRDLYVAFVGSAALVSSDPALLGEALRQLIIGNALSLNEQR
jgi:hypothetical protein